MPRQINVTLYKLDELNDKAKDKAHQNWIHNDPDGYHFSDDALSSLRKLAEHFDGQLSDYSIDWTNSSYSSADFEMPEMEPNEIRERLGQLGEFNPETLKGLGDCKLTGYCMDESAIDGFRIAFIRERETDLNQLMQAAFKVWLSHCHDDYEGQISEESFAEWSEVQNVEYYANGDVYTDR